MDGQALIARARAGDMEAFTEVVRRHQDMAFGYAFSILGDVHLAQNVAQAVFLTTYTDLPRLKEPAKFPAWPRGVVRNHCRRMLRTRRRQAPTIPLDEAGDQAAPTSGPDRQVEERDALDQILAAINRLPQTRREVAVLFYLEAYSQREIAQFLNLPVSTVNNRLHSARQQLRGGIAAMARDAFRQRGLPEDFAARVGRIVQARGAVIEARFEPGTAPPPLTALDIADDAGAIALTIEVARHLGDGLVRCIAPTLPVAVTAGMRAIDTRRPTQAPISAEAVRDAILTTGTPATGAALLETGIKVIDLLCPYPATGVIGLFGDLGSGKMVLINEVLHNAAGAWDDAAVFAFVQTGEEVPHIQRSLPELRQSERITFVAVADPRDLAAAPAMPFDAMTFTTRDLAGRGYYPAVDPILSTSRLLDPAIVGQEHHDVALAVRHLLQQARALRVKENLTNEEAALVARAGRIERFLTQPLFVAEAFTRRPGRRVSRAETVRACAALLRDAYDQAPDEALMWRGGMDEEG